MPMDKTTGVISFKKSDVEIPDGFVHDFILEHVMKDLDPNLPFETEFATGAASTYGWLLDTHHRVASWLREIGIKQGDRVAFYSTSCIEYSPCVLATWRVGATCTFIRPEMIADLEYRAAVGIPKIVFASKGRVSQLSQAGYENIVVYRCSPEEVPAGGYSFDEILRGKRGKLEEFQIEGAPGEVLAIVAFSGGTTGNPKPIQLSHRNVISTFAFEANGVPLCFGTEPGNHVQLCHFPTVHVSGILFRLSTLLRKGHTILLDPPILPRKVCEAVQKYHVNILTTIPVALISLMRFPELREYDLTSWQTCMLVGGTLPAYIQEDACKRLGLKYFYQRLAMTECCGSVLCATRVPESVGDICPNTQAKVVSLETGAVVTEPDVVGELCVRGPQVMVSYYNLPEKNKTAFDDDGFLRTGDLVRFDEHLNFYYFDRAQEFLRHSSGRMISATKLELIIAYQNPSVLEVSVIPSASGPRAIIVPAVWPEDEGALKHDIITRTNSVIDEDWKHLTGGVVFLRASEVPRSVLGKHLKRLMKHL